MDLFQRIKDNRRCLNITGIEEIYEIPRGVLMSAVNGDRKLPDKYLDSLGKFFEALGIESVVVSSEPIVSEITVENIEKDKVVIPKAEKKNVDSVPDGYELMRFGEWRHIMNGYYTNGKKTVKPKKVKDNLYVPK